MKKSALALLVVLLTGITLNSCKEKKPVTNPEDLDAPTISMTSPEVMEYGSFVYLSSVDSFNIDIRFEDDIELDRYEITIRWKEDLNWLKTNNFPWKETWTGELDGTVDGVNFIEFVPYDPSAGPYEFHVTVWDVSGKETSLSTYLYITNNADPNPPTITYTSPNPAAVDTYMIGQTIPIQGQASDAVSYIEDVYIRVRNAFTEEIMVGSEIYIDTTFVNPYVIDTFVVVPAGTVPGDYNVETYAEDPIKNWGKGVVPIYIKEN